MERALGEVPHVDKAYWDWRKQIGWVRFVPGEVAHAQDLADAIQDRTMFSSGAVEFVTDAGELPDELR